MALMGGRVTGYATPGMWRPEGVRPVVCPGPHMSERMCGRVSGLAVGWFQRGAPGVPNFKVGLDPPRWDL